MDQSRRNVDRSQRDQRLPLRYPGSVAGQNGLAALLHCLPLSHDYSFILVKKLPDLEILGFDEPLDARWSWPALYFTVLGDSAIRMPRYQQQYTFFDPSKLPDSGACQWFFCALGAIRPEARALASAGNQALNLRKHLRPGSGARCATGSCACLSEASAMAVRPQSSNGPSPWLSDEF
jgi:hypothetical protein